MQSHGDIDATCDLVLRTSCARASEREVERGELPPRYFRTARRFPRRAGRGSRRHVMHLVSLAVVPDRPQAGTALMNEVTLRNADAYTRGALRYIPRRERAFNADLRSGRAAFRHSRSHAERMDRERERERDFLSNRRQQFSARCSNECKRVLCLRILKRKLSHDCRSQLRSLDLQARLLPSPCRSLQLINI